MVNIGNTRKENFITIVDRYPKKLLFSIVRKSIILSTLKGNKLDLSLALLNELSKKGKNKNDKQVNLAILKLPSNLVLLTCSLRGLKVFRLPYLNNVYFDYINIIKLVVIMNNPINLNCDVSKRDYNLNNTYY